MKPYSLTDDLDELATGCPDETDLPCLCAREPRDEETDWPEHIEDAIDNLPVDIFLAYSCRHW
jgi:hypothetical protein